MKRTTPYFIGIDLHSNNLFAAVVDANGNRIEHRRIECDLYAVDKFLHPMRSRIESIAVESTFNWYWLVDGLKAMGFDVLLANPARIDQYSGVKHADDKHDAYWIAELLRQGVLETGYICPADWRATRDLLRRRQLLISHRTSLLLSLRNLQVRNFGFCELSSNDLKHVPVETVTALFDHPSDKMMADTEKIALDVLSTQISRIERQVIGHARELPGFERLLAIPGIGPILAMTIAMEIVDISRFPTAEDFASYCRMVPARRISNAKKKAENNRRCGNRYLCWAFIEAANFLCRNDPRAKRWHDRKAAKSLKALATKALGCKLAKAVWYVLKQGTDYDGDRLFGPQKVGRATTVRATSGNQKKGLKIESVR